MRWLTVTLLVIGACLLALAAYIYPWTWAETADGYDAGLKLAQIKAADVRTVAESVTKFRIPNSEEWRRLIGTWGPPKFIVGVECQSAKPQLACFPQMGLEITLTDLAGRAIPTNPSDGYTSRCEVTGVEFVGDPGSEFLLHVTRPGNQFVAEGELIIMPYWPDEKDRIVGAMIAPTFARVAFGFGGVGICCLLLCLWSYRRQIAKHGTA
jgi:hypothetical protein